MRLIRGLLIIVCGAIASSCVSSTLESAKPEPNVATSELALSEEDLNSQRLRSEGIAQIHAKADAMPINESAPAYGLPRKGETDLLTQAEIREKSRNVTTASQATEAQVSDAELDATRAKMLALQKKGSSHYESAVGKIEKN